MGIPDHLTCLLRNLYAGQEATVRTGHGTTDWFQIGKGVRLTRWTWVWVSSGSWWWTGRPGLLRFMGSQRVGHDWVTDLIWCMDVRVGLWRKLSAEELMLLNYMVLEKTLESPLDCKEIQPDHPKGDQPWVFFGRNDAKAEIPVLWPPNGKSWLIGKDSDSGRDWGQEEKRTTEDEMAGWYHWLDGYESEWALGVGDGQGGLACCSSWGRKESDTTEGLKWTELMPLTATEWIVNSHEHTHTQMNVCTHLTVSWPSARQTGRLSNH